MQRVSFVRKVFQVETSNLKLPIKTQVNDVLQILLELMHNKAVHRKSKKAFFICLVKGLIKLALTLIL